MTSITAKAAPANLGDILDTLGTGVHLVTFTKKDGTERTLRATRDGSIIPASATTGNDRRRDQGGLVAVYDLDEEKWKGFFPHNLIGISPA